MENIKLDNGKFLNRVYGKYSPNITFISNIELNCENLKKIRMDTSVINPNLKFDGIINEIYKGWYRKNAKGTDVFEHDKNGKHFFVCVSWGGAFDSSSGKCLTPKVHFLYYRRASSNGGGTGYNYFIFENNCIDKLSEDDF